VGDQRTVLVIEDDPALGRFLVDSLADEGYAVRHAKDGLDALDMLADWCPDLILLDLSLPRMDGREFLRAKHDLPAPAAAIPAIVVSGTREGTVGLGVTAVLHKPFEIEALFDAVAAAIDQGPRG
jgi:CheY-like chemotaxis protein